MTVYLFLFPGRCLHGDTIEGVAYKMETLRNHEGNVKKTSLENTSSRYLYYFALIPNRSTSTMWPNYPVTELMGTVFNLAQKMKIYCNVLTLSIKP